MKNKNISIFLDSGAFSAWSQKIDIDIDEYIAFIKKYKKYIDVYANLDVIGDAVGTYENQKYMESKGLNPIPVFHPLFEPVSWLEKYINKKYDYIAMGGMAGGSVTVKQILPMLDMVFKEYLCDKNGMPKMKVHGFGLTSHRLMLRYPWYSVDSTSWVMTGRMGSVFIPVFILKKNASPSHDLPSWKITFSNKSPSQKEQGKHFTTLTSLEQKRIKEYLKYKGYTVEELAIDYKKRDELNIIYFLDLEKSMQKWPWAFKQKKAQGFL